MRYKNEDPENLGRLGGLLPAEVLKMLNELLEQLHQADYINQGSKIEIVYVASGGQHVDKVERQYIGSPSPDPSSVRASPPDPSFPSRARLPVAFPVREGSAKGVESKEGYREGICQCIAQLMEERVGDGSLFNRQSHWQAVYRILVDKGYCRDSDFDGFDAFIRAVMPEKVNKPYRKDSVKIISQTDFNKPFDKWRYESKTSGTRKPFERMCAVAGRFKELLEEQGL